eukprot:scaffold7638_cov131-Isochrysis_galbana.AAC.11
MRPGRASKSKLFALARAILAQCWRAAPHRDAQHTLMTCARRGSMLVCYEPRQTICFSSSKLQVKVKAQAPSWCHVGAVGCNSTGSAVLYATCSSPEQHAVIDMRPPFRAAN